jgi:hypothetical protein
LVADCASKGVVDVFEVIKVQGHYRESASPTRLETVQLLVKTAPVDQAGEVVPLGLANELLLGCLALGHILIGAEDGDDLAVGIVEADSGDGDFHQVPVAVPALTLDLDDAVAGRGSTAKLEALSTGAELNELKRSAHDFGRTPAEQSLSGRVPEQRHATEIRHH